jgi:hypothetical protein
MLINVLSVGAARKPNMQASRSKTKIDQGAALAC